MEQLNRDQMTAWIMAQGLEVIGTSEEFRQDLESGIWVSGERSENMYAGRRAYNFYSMEPEYRIGVLDRWETQLNMRGWYSQWWDAGTVMIYPIEQLEQ